MPVALLSRRQYLSRMDRFQHGRSARTLGLEDFNINRQSGSALVITDPDDRQMFLKQRQALKIVE
ncbi:hypothetical protein ACQKPE_17995 [Pseudomonas sp. NPDC089554]|uniref:hypothetical protein n=1 Tax=Pseudomonas sp. NPDC089554 TaxID=3390653 RepID=UPI003D087EC1